MGRKKKQKLTIGDNNIFKNSSIQYDNMATSNEVNIGSGNNFKRTTFQSNNTVPKSEKWYQKLTWKIIVPIAIAIVGGLILAYVKRRLGLS